MVFRDENVAARDGSTEKCSSFKRWRPERGRTRRTLGKGQATDGQGSCFVTSGKEADAPEDTLSFHVYGALGAASVL